MKNVFLIVAVCMLSVIFYAKISAPDETQCRVEKRWLQSMYATLHTQTVPLVLHPVEP